MRLCRFQVERGEYWIIGREVGGTSRRDLGSGRERTDQDETGKRVSQVGGFRT